MGRMPAETFHLTEYLQDEMDERGWSRDRLAVEMGGDPPFNRAMLDLYFEVGPTNPGLRIGVDAARQLSVAFGVSAEFFLNLERHWLLHKHGGRDGVA